MQIPKDMLNQFKNKQALERLSNLSPQEGEELMKSTPEWIRDKLYARCCSRQECQDLCDSWLEKQPERIANLNHQLKKQRRGFQIIAISNQKI